MFQTLKVFYKFIFKYKWLFWFSIFVIAIGALSKNLIPFYIGQIVDKAISTKVVGWDIVLILVLVMSFRLFIIPVGRQLSDIILTKVSKDVWLKVFEHIHNLDFAYHVNKSSGSLISLFRRGEGGLVSLYLNVNVHALEIVLEFIFLFVLLLNLYPKMFVITFVIALLNIASMYFLIKRNVETRNKSNEYWDIVTGITVDNMINFDTVKYFAKEEYEQSKLKKWLKIVRGAEMKYVNTFRAIELISGGIVNYGMVAMIVVALIDLNAGLITTGTFVSVVSFATLFAPRLTDLIYNLREVAKNFTDTEKYMKILGEEIKIIDTPKPEAVEIWNSFDNNSKYSIKFENVNFSYNQNNKVLKDFNLEVKDNESIALVGQSGAGKTTVTKLLMRLYNPNSGNILINGIDIKDIKKTDLRKKIGIVPQETILFNDTIGYNIGYGKINYEQSELDNAAKSAHLYDFVMSLPDKYDTMVGERGIKLSGGQKQRLGIARVFMEDAPIIIFDEATSNLDSESERLIQEAFWKLAKNRTTIIIAHRLSTIKKADRIIVVDNGEVKEIGTHEELTQKSSGIYKYLWKLQAGGEVE